MWWCATARCVGICTLALHLCQHRRQQKTVRARANSVISETGSRAISAVQLSSTYRHDLLQGFAEGKLTRKGRATRERHEEVLASVTGGSTTLLCFHCCHSCLQHEQLP